MIKLWILLGFLGWYLPSGNCNDLLPQCFTVQSNECPNSNVSFWLYSQQEPWGRLLNPSNLEGFNLQSPKGLKVLIHSLAGNRNTSPNREIRSELLKFPNLYIISVDYAKLTPDPCYMETTENIYVVARCLAMFLGDLLYRRIVKPDQVHLIGDGIGAHAAAFTSNYLAQTYGKVNHITALDPAKASYVTPDISKRLDSSDANFVDVIHSDVFIHGLLKPLGHVDFYPNMGLTQPNCGSPDDIETHDCYHKRASEYYAESIFSPTKFWGFYCQSIMNIALGSCKPNSKVEEMGYHARKIARGIYYLATNKGPPYARGLNFHNMDRSLAGKTFMPMEMVNKLMDLNFKGPKSG